MKTNFLFRNFVSVFIALMLSIGCYSLAAAQTQTAPAKPPAPDNAMAPQTQPAPAPAPAPVKPDSPVGSFIRKTFNVPANVGIEVSDQANSTIPGLKMIKVVFNAGDGRPPQAQDAWILPDGKNLLVGRLMDMSIDPYKENLAKMNLEGAPVTGTPTAKVTIVEYTDFQCPFCSRANTTVEQLMKEFDGKVKLVYKSLPLNIHNWAEDAAVGATCVAEQNNDAFWKYGHFLFENQKTITKDTLSEKLMGMAKENSVDATKLKACIDAKTTLPKVQADMKEAQGLGFNSTPSFVVNGRPVVGALPVEQFRQIINDAIAAAAAN